MSLTSARSRWDLCSSFASLKSAWHCLALPAWFDDLAAPGAGKAGAIQPVPVRPKSRSSVRLVASVAATGDGGYEVARLSTRAVLAGGGGRHRKRRRQTAVLLGLWTADAGRLHQTKSLEHAAVTVPVHPNFCVVRRYELEVRCVMH